MNISNLYFNDDSGKVLLDSSKLKTQFQFASENRLMYQYVTTPRSQSMVAIQSYYCTSKKKLSC